MTQQTSQADSVVISANPKAGRTSPMLRAEELKRSLERKGFVAELLTDLNVVGERANQLFADGRLRALIGVGGDGTAAELVNRTSPGTPISLLPAGTANLIAKQFRLPFDPQKMATTIETGATLTLDAGRANGRLFLVMVSAGIDADIVRQVHQRREECYRRQTKQGAHISYFSYLKPIFSSLSSFSYPKIDVEIRETTFAPSIENGTETSNGISSESQKQAANLSDGISEKTLNSDAISSNETVLKTSNVRQDWGKWAFVFNLPRYGWGLPLVPDCVGDDEKLDFCLFRRGGFPASILNVLFAQCGSSHRLLPNARLGTGTVFRLTSERPVPFQLDGDPGGFLPVSIEIVPRRFTIVAPSNVVSKYRRR